MKLYNNFGFNFSFEKIKKPLIIGLTIIIIVLAFIALNGFLQPKALVLSFSENPLTITKEGKNYTVLSITITNTLNETAENIKLIVKPIDSTALSINSEKEKEESLTILGANESRTLKFIVMPVDSEKILQGKYKIQAILYLNSKEFKEETTLEIIK